LKFWKDLFERWGEGNVEKCLKFFEHLKEQGEMTEKQMAELVVAKLMDYVSKMFGLYFTTLQTSFKEIIVDGKTIRADMFIRNPSDAKFKLIIECDGYETHSLKKAFSNDRTRDRLLQMSGFQVFRFSGSDINAKPQEMARHLYEYLLKQKTS
jgi:REase_MTES_1575